MILIPAFNVELVLEQTLNALLQQLLSDQVLVVSDGSTDKSTQIVNDKRINLLGLPFVSGVGAAMRSGLRFAKENGFQK